MVKIPAIQRKSLHQRLVDYQKARERIFNDEILEESMKTRKYKKIEKLRERVRIFKKIKNIIISAVITMEGDNRFYAKTNVDGEQVVALLDSGAGANCIGKNAAEFLGKRESRIIKIKNQKIRTANGSGTSVTGMITLPVEWEGETRDMDFLIVPELNQQMYFGVDFWRIFNLNLVSRGKLVNKEGLSIDELLEATADKRVCFDANQHVLSESETLQLEEVKRLFPSFEQFGLGRTNKEEHVIEVIDEGLPIKQRHYPISPVIQGLIFEELDRMLKIGVIEESNSSWSSPVTLVRKVNKNRLCLDARKLNSRTVKDAYPLPHIEGILSRLQETRFISAIDLKDAFWQIPLEKKSREKTAFTVPGRPLYQFTVMPFGLCNAAQRMCRLMDKVIPASIREFVFVYLDDLLVCSLDFSSHMELLSVVADCLSKAKLTINVSKSKFCYREVRYLGYVVGDGCLRTDKDKVAAMEEFPEPKTPRQLRRFLGMTGWYRRFIKDYASIAAPLHEALTKEKLKKFSLSEEAKQAFKDLKQSLVTAPVLSTPDFKKHFYIQCDASSEGVGGVLFQVNNDGEERPIAYLSSKLNKAQKNYSVTEQECYAAVLSVKKFRPYVEGLPFTIITDHSSLKWLMSQKELSGRLARWSLKLQAYDFKIEHRKGSQNVVPDTLSRIDMDEVKVDDQTVDVDVNSVSFSSEEYEELKATITNNKEDLPDLCVSDGFVYKRTEIRTGDALQEDLAWKLWVPADLRTELVERTHCLPSSGHGGIHKTLVKLQQIYYWPGMASDVQAMVKECEICKSCKTSNNMKRPPMGVQQITERPFQRLYIDFMGPYPRTRDGNTYIFVCLDHFSKYVYLKPLRKATAGEVVKCLEREVFHVFGVPEFVHSDNGKQFVSVLFGEFLQKYGVRHIKTAFYSPQANASERVNRSILQIIRSYIGDDQKGWDLHLSEAAFALRSGVHSSIGMSPYYAVFGINMIQHARSYEVGRKLCSLKDATFTMETHADKNQLIRDKILTELKKAHLKNVKVYNTRSKDVKFKEGQMVYRKNFRQSNLADGYNAKLAPPNVRCVVLKSIGNSLYELGTQAGKKLGIYHAKDMFAA